ncbi:hypothetical protein Tco_0847889 [Tanacetum coccineum]
MSTSHISSYSDSDNESTGSSVSYIILSDLEVKNIASPAAVTPPLADYVLVLPDYILISDIETEPFEAPTSPNYTPGKMVRATFTLPLAIKVAILEEIVAPPHKRCRSPSPPSPSSSSAPS